MRRRRVRPCHLRTVEPHQTNLAPAVQHNDMQLYHRSDARICFLPHGSLLLLEAVLHRRRSLQGSAASCQEGRQMSMCSGWHHSVVAQQQKLRLESAMQRLGNAPRQQILCNFTLAWRSTRVQCSQKSSGLPWRRSRSRCVVARCTCCRFRRCRAWWPSHPQNALRVRMWYRLMCWMAS